MIIVKVSQKFSLVSEVTDKFDKCFLAAISYSLDFNFFRNLVYPKWLNPHLSNSKIVCPWSHPSTCTAGLRKAVFNRLYRVRSEDSLRNICLHTLRPYWEFATYFTDSTTVLTLKGVLTQATCVLSECLRMRYSEAKASVSGASNMLCEWVSDLVRDFSPWASSATEVATETKFGTKVA